MHDMPDKGKTKKQLMSELVKTREGVAEFESSVIERKRVEEQFQLVVESVPNAIVMVNQKGEIILVNSLSEKMFGYNREELMGQTVEILVPERFRSRHPEYHMGFYANPQAKLMGAGRDLFALRKDGNEFPVEIGFNPVQTDEGLLVLGAIVDITERKRAEGALLESEERLQAIINNTSDAILVYDEEGRVITINKEAKRLFCDDLKNELKSMWDIIPQEDQVDFSDRLKSVKEGSRIADFDTQKILKSGKRMFVSVGLAYVNQKGGRFIETIRDINERVNLRNKIVEFEKAQLIGKIAEGIAHHLGTPLASMLLRVQMLKEDFLQMQEYANVVEKLDSVERQIFYSQKVLQRLLRFARKAEKERCLESISSLIEEGVEIITPLIRKQGIELELSFCKDTKILADSDLLELVFSDIIMNAVDAMPEGGKLSIVACKNDTEDLVEITISDTGIGIPREVLQFVFEPFFTTKPAGKGTGLGLSVARSIIHDHGGGIRIDSVERKGTSVWIKIPISKEGREFA